MHHFNLPGQAILSIDGIGAYDHVLRSAMMYKLHRVPGFRGLLPFVRTTYAHPTGYRWQDAVGVTHQVHEAEGGEQGDPLMHLLFNLAIHDALVAVQTELREGQSFVLFAFLDDVYVVTGPNRSREVFDLLADHLWRVAGIWLHTVKTRVWNRSGVSPQNVEDLGEQVWNRECIKVLDTPIGTDQFVSDALTERVQEENKLWEAIELVRDLQAWQILIQCAARSAHLLRTLPPSQSGHYAALHDARILRATKSLLGGVP